MTEAVSITLPLFVWPGRRDTQPRRGQCRAADAEGHGMGCLQVFGCNRHEESRLAASVAVFLKANSLAWSAGGAAGMGGSGIASESI